MEVLAFLGGLKLFTKLTAAECRSYNCVLGKTAVVTGGTSEVGLETALALASRGCKVIIADEYDGEEAVKRIQLETQNEKIVHKKLDLASFKSIRAFAEDLNQNEKRLDLLINNAETGGYGRTYTEDRLLKTMQVNHYGPFLLTYLLTKLLKKTDDSRIVFVSSLSAFFHHVETLDDIVQSPRIKRDLKHNAIEYSNSKLCSIIASSCFARKLQTSGVMCNCVHPGIVDTDNFESIFTNMGSHHIDASLAQLCLPMFLRIYGKTPREGAQTALHCALNSRLNTTGRLYVDCREFLLPPKAQIDSFRWDVWRASEKIVGIQDSEKL